MHTGTIWDVLINCAHAKQTISEKTLAGMLGIGLQELPQALEPIRLYCREHNLLPLHALVVSESEVDGEDVDEGHYNRLNQMYFWIFDYDWKSCLPVLGDDGYA